MRRRAGDEIDAQEETPQFRHKKEMIEKEQAVRALHKPVKVWLERRGEKILRFTLKANGNRSSVLVIRIKKDNKDAVSFLKADAVKQGLEVVGF